MQDRFKFKWFSKKYKKIFEVACLEFPDIVVYIDEDGNEVETSLSSDYGELIQCTGLKDKNGKLIYEGNIVRSDEYPYMSKEQDNYYAEICWDKKFAQFFYYTFKNPKFNDVRGISTGNTGNLDDHNWEVIGTIYEHPELLEDK